MNTRNTRFIAFFMLLNIFFLPGSKAMECRGLQLSILNKGTSFLQMIKNTPLCLESPRIKRLMTEYDKSMQEITNHAIKKPNSVLPISFYLSVNFHPPLPVEYKSHGNWSSKDSECSYWCGLCKIKLLNSKEYDAHMLHCYNQS